MAQQPEDDETVAVKFEVRVDAQARRHLENVLAGVTAHGRRVTVRELVAGYCRAAGEEGLEQLVGRSDYPNKTDARQRLLRRLVTVVFAGQMPPARLVAGLFHLPLRGGTTLVNNTTARYYAELAAARNAAAAEALRNRCVLVEEAKAGQRSYRFRCADTTIIGHLRDLLADSPTAAHPITSDSDAVATYIVHDSALTVLADALEVEVSDLLAKDQPAPTPAAAPRRGPGRKHKA